MVVAGRKRTWFSLAALLTLLCCSYFYLVFRPSDVVSSKSNRKLRVLSYSSFTSPWAVGPDLAKRFERKFGIQIEYFDADESRLIINRLSQVNAGSPQFDVVLGVDQYDVTRARTTTQWRSIGHLAKDKTRNSQLSLTLADPDFVPIDWAPLSFIYRTGEIAPPKSVQDLLDSRFQNRLILLDPRSSGPGYLFLLWLKHNLGDQLVNFLKKFKSNVQLISPSWSTGYGLFQKAQADSVFSYVTSAAYHWSEEKLDKYAVAVFEEALPIQVEFVGIPKDCSSCEAAEEFVQFLLTEESQMLLMRKNYMLPVFAEHTQDAYFGRLPRVKAIQVLDQSKALEEFVTVFR
jgi:thiamine transport system substrate-binding protein